MDRRVTSPNLTWDQPLFSFRFENYIPVGKAKRKESPILAVAVRENVWEPLKLGLISGYTLLIKKTLTHNSIRENQQWFPKHQETPFH